MVSVGIKSRLVRTGDSHLKVADPTEDIRGRKVMDRDGEEMGEVKDLLVDEQERKVRFFEMQSGGVLGVGGQRTVIPVDAIVNIDADAVYIDQTRERIVSAPAYNPELVDDAYWTDVYGFYGYPPYWTAGYIYPPFPAYPRKKGATKGGRRR